MEIIEINPETIMDLILKNYNMYFTMRSLKKTFLKELDPKKAIIYQERRSSHGLGRRLGHSLKPLIKKGFIERYNPHTFKIVQI